MAPRVNLLVFEDLPVILIYNVLIVINCNMIECKYMKHVFELRMKDQIGSSVGRALHRHRRGHGFESRSSLNFFQAFFSQLLKLRNNCEDLSFI